MKRRWVLAGILATGTVVLEVLFRHAGHPVFAWHSLPAFDLVFGALGCGLIVVVSKALGRAFLQKPESYYGKEEE